MGGWRNFLVFVGVLATTATAHSVAEACPRWEATFDPCVPFPAECNSTAFEDRKFITGLLWTETAAEACNNWAVYGMGYSSGEIVGQGPGFVNCAEPGSPDQYTTLYEYDKTEDCCQRVPNGPHTNIDNLDPVSNADVANDRSYTRFPYPFVTRNNNPVVQQAPTPGEEFTWYGPLRYGRGSAEHHSQIINVRRSMAVPGSPLDNKGYPTQTYSALRDHPTLGNLELCPDGVLDSSFSPGALCRPEVDHIIPKKDIYGCDCGSNSYSNAILISVGLNQSMSNDCENPDRIAIMNEYAPLAFAANGEAPEAYSSDEGNDVNGSADRAGCGVGGTGLGHGWGFVGLGVALATIARVRRIAR